MTTVILLDGVTASGAGSNEYQLPLGSGHNLARTFPVVVRGISGDTVVLQGSLDGTNWVTLDGATFTADIGATLITSFKYIRANVTVYSAGTITVELGV